MTSWRSAHRSRSHDSAHAESDDAGGHHDHVDHPLVPRGPAPLLVDQDSLDKLVDELRAAGAFAYDTEFIGELSYHPLLCVIQVATAQRVVLVDPMVELDLTRFWELLADESVLKIVHAGEQDVEPVARHLGRSRGARYVVDTQIAAGFAGMAFPVALSKLVHELAGVKLGKGLTFTHWDQRPLSAVQLRYAADDVRYLPAIWDALRQRLESLGHLDWARQECDAMCDPSHFGFNRDATFLKMRGAGNLSNPQLMILRELSVWRDGAARAANAPPRALVRDEVLVDLSRSPAKTIEKLSRVRGLPRPVEAEHGQEIVEATLRAASMPPEHLAPPKHAEPTPTQRFRADALFTTAAALCAARSIDLALAASRQDIGELHRRLLTSESVEDLPLFNGWRREALGEPLLRFTRGEEILSLAWRDGALRGEPRA